MTRQQALLHEIDVASFQMDEAVLFLDTNPTNAEALAYYHEAQCRRMEAMRQYETEFGPLSKYRVQSETRFDWTDGPWPWQQGGGK